MHGRIIIQIHVGHSIRVKVLESRVVRNGLGTFFIGFKKQPADFFPGNAVFDEVYLEVGIVLTCPRFLDRVL